MKTIRVKCAPLELLPGPENLIGFVFDGMRPIRLTQPVATTPDGFDVGDPFGSSGQLPAQFTYEYIDNLAMGLDDTVIEVIQEHVLGYDCTRSEREEFQHLVLHIFQDDRPVTYIDGPRSQIYRQLSRPNCRSRRRHGAAQKVV